MKSKIQYDFKYRIELPHFDIGNLPSIFGLEVRNNNSEIYSSTADKEEVSSLIKDLENIDSVTYTEMFVESISIPKGFLNKPKLDKRKLPKKFLREKKEFIDDFEEKRPYSKLEKPLHLEEGKKKLAKVLQLPKINPERFKELCDTLKNEHSEESYYPDGLKDYFPYHSEPYAFKLEDKISFSMLFRRDILINNKFWTNVLISASYNPQEGDFLDETVKLVHDSMMFLLGKHNPLKSE